MNEIELLVKKIQEEEAARIASIQAAPKPASVNIAKTLVQQNIAPSVSLEQKKENLTNFLVNMKNELFKIFTSSNERYLGEIQIDSNGSLSFVYEIQAGSSVSEEHIAVVTSRNHRFTKLDAVDGEAMFVYLMNPILEYLQFDTRYLLDGRSYKSMGDNGDFKFGGERLDIKTRQVKATANKDKVNLLINESTVNNKFNYYGLVHREGDAGLEGNQRRLTLIGTATAAQVKSKTPKYLGKSEKLGLKYEVDQNELSSLTMIISQVCQEIFYRGGANP